jgi:hypothetical protein
MPKLRSLCLSGYVNDIETHALERMPCLEVLILEGSMWKTSDSPQSTWLFHLPTSIRRLVVAQGAMELGFRLRDRLCEIVPYVRALHNLQGLTIVAAPRLRLLEWEEPFSRHLTGLTLVELMDCGLRALPPCVASLTTLKSLTLSVNPLHGLPVAPYLSGLSRLMVDHCEMPAFPLEAISRATALTRLCLRGNSFEWTEEANEAVKHIQTVQR